MRRSVERVDVSLSGSESGVHSHTASIARTIKAVSGMSGFTNVNNSNQYVLRFMAQARSSGLALARAVPDWLDHQSAAKLLHVGLPLAEFIGLLPQFPELGFGPENAFNGSSRVEH